MRDEKFAGATRSRKAKAPAPQSWQRAGAGSATPGVEEIRDAPRHAVAVAEQLGDPLWRPRPVGQRGRDVDLLLDEGRRVQVVYGAARPCGTVRAAAMKEHRVHDDERAGGRLDLPRPLRHVGVRGKLLVQVAARQDMARAVVGGEVVDAVKSV